MKHLPRLFALSSLAVSTAFAQSELDIPEPLPTEAPAMEPVPSGARPIQAGVQLWLSSGHGEWEIEFGELFFTGRSKLEWEDIDAPVLVLHAEIPIGERWSVGGLVGYGELTDGKNTDGDWLADFQVSESQASTDGDVKLGDINLYYNLVRDEAGGDNFTFDVFIGYQHYKDSLRDTEGVQTIDAERRVNRPFDNLKSRYRFEWQMLRAGARASIDLDPSFTIGGSLALLYLLDYTGEGYWNLRDDFRRTDPNFVQSTSKGWGLDAKLTARVRITESIHVDGGYWLLVMNGEDGTDTIYFADGTEGESKVTDVTSLRHGLFGGVTVEF